MSPGVDLLGAVLASSSLTLPVALIHEPRDYSPRPRRPRRPSSRTGNKLLTGHLPDFSPTLVYINTRREESQESKVGFVIHGQSLINI